MNEFLKRVLEELDFLNASKAELARFLNVRKSTVYSWFERDSIPAADTALKIAEFLNVSLEYLITGKESPQVHTMPPPLDDREKELLEDFRKLNETDKIESIAIIKLKLNLYQTLSATNGKTATIKDC